MRAEEHMAKALRLEDTCSRKLDLREDYELVIWGYIHGGAQLLNVLFHRHGFTPDDFDMIHTFVPELDRAVPSELGELVEMLKNIETLGPRFVRGAEPWTPEITSAGLAAYRALKIAAEQALQDPRVGLRRG